MLTSATNQGIVKRLAAASRIIALGYDVGKGGNQTMVISESRTLLCQKCGACLNEGGMCPNCTGEVGVSVALGPY